MARKRKSRGKKRIVRVTRGRAARKGRRRGATKLTLNLTGLKRAVGGGKPVIFTLLGAILARVMYGVGMKYMPDQDPRLVGAGAVAATIAAGILASGKIAVAGPIAVGAAGMGLLDMFADQIAGAVPATSPEIAQAIAGGVGRPVYQAALPPMPLNGGALPSPDVVPDQAGLTGYFPNQYGMGEPNQYGFGDVDMIYA